MGRQFPVNLRSNALLCVMAVTWLLPTGAAIAAVSADRLQALVNDTAAQVQLAYRRHPDERKHRQDQLAAVVTAWRAAARSEANNEQLATWLHAAIQSSMPGSRDPLPPTPTFAASATIEARASGSAAAEKARVTPGAKPEANPFRDDPATERE